ELEIYLPAYGSPIRYLQRKGERADIFGMDLSFEDLTWEILDNYQYVHREQKITGNLEYDVIDVYAAGDDTGSVHPVRRHHVRRDGFYIMQTDFFDNQGRVLKRQTRHDVSRSSRNLWNTGMMLVENIQKHHTTLIKVNKRIISDDYVPDEVFSLNWLFQNQPPLEQEETDAEVFRIYTPGSGQLSFQSGPSAGKVEEAY
ncbi:MAG: outer membrane lipoprotein-sorting protein, partial [Gammaproteobacteria bacterium]